MDKDNKQIKESFDDFLDNTTPPNLWESIGNELKTSEVLTDDELIEQSFMKVNEVEPSETIWANIEEELNFDLVWWRMTSILNRMRTKAIWWRKTRIVASFLVLFLFVQTCVPSEEIYRDQLKLVAENTSTENQSPANPNRLAITNTSTTLFYQSKHQQHFSKEKNTGAEIIQEKNRNQEQRAKSTVINKIKGIAENINYTTFSVANSKNKERQKANGITLSAKNGSNSPARKPTIALSALYPDLLENRSPERNKLLVYNKIASTQNSFPKIEIGNIATIGTSLFLNYETQLALDPKTSRQTQLMVTYSGGLSMHYLLDPKNRIGAELYFFERSAQRYFNYSRSGEYLNLAKSMNYSKLNIFYQRNLLPSNCKTNLSLKGGVYTAFLYNEKETVNKWTYLENTHYFKRFDVGGNVALGQSHALGNLVVDYGLFAELSFVNVFNGDGWEPAHFKKTRILDTGAYLSLRYSLN